MDSTPSGASAPGNVAGNDNDDVVIDRAGAFMLYITPNLASGLSDITLNSAQGSLWQGYNWGTNSTASMRTITFSGLFDIQAGTYSLDKGGAALAGTGQLQNAGVIDIRASNGVTLTFSQTGGVSNLAGGIIQLGKNNAQTGSDNKQHLQVAGPFSNAGNIILSTVSPGGGNSSTILESTHASDKTLTNTGTIDVLKGGGGLTTFTVPGSSANYAGATSTGGTDALWNERNLLLRLDNQGTLNIDNPVTRETRLGLASGAANHTNSGTIQIGTGSILRLTNLNTLENLQAGQITGNGKLELLGGSSFKSNQNDGGFAPGIGGAGTLSVLVESGATLTNSPTASLSIELGGTAAGTQYDQLAVSGATLDSLTGWSVPVDNAIVNLNGELDVSFINGFEAGISAADEFTILTASAINGAFVNAVPLTGNVATLLTPQFSFDVTYNTDSVVLSNYVAIPEPAGVAALGIAAMTLVSRRRRA